MHTRLRRHSSRIEVFEDENLIPGLPTEIVPPQPHAVGMIEIIRLLVIRMHMRALDEAAFAYAPPIRECQWVIFNRASECGSPDAAAPLSASDANVFECVAAIPEAYLKTRMRPPSSFSVAAPNRFWSCSAR